MSSLLFCRALLRRTITAVLLLMTVVVLAHDPQPAVVPQALSSDILWDDSWTSGAFELPDISFIVAPLFAPRIVVPLLSS